MKQTENDDKVIRNVLIAAGLLAALSLLLLFGLGAGLYQNIVNAIHKTGNGGLAGANIYDVYYYKCFALFYGALYSISLFSGCLATFSLLFRKNGALKLAKLAFAAQAATAVYVLISCLLEESVTAHRIAAGLYIQDVAASFEVTKALGIRPLVVSVILLVLSLGGLAFLCRFIPQTLKIYTGGGMNVCSLIIPVLYGSIFMETVRPLLEEWIYGGAGAAGVVYAYIRDYYFAGLWDFGFPYVWFLLAFCVFMLLAERIQKKKDEAADKRAACGIAAGVLLFLIIRAALFCANPPRLFGYLTLDEAVCDATETAYLAYILLFLQDILLLLVMLMNLFAAKKTEHKNNGQHALRAVLMFNQNKMLLAVCGIHAAVGITGVLFGRSLTVAGCFAFLAVTDLLASVCLSYMANIRRRNH